MRQENDLQVDEIEIEIDGVVMKMSRRSSLSTPAEVSAIIPRVEIRKKIFENGKPTMEKEMILNSITIIHSPRHPLAGDSRLKEKGPQDKTAAPPNFLPKISVNGRKL